VPRPDRPELFDEQAGFVNGRDLVAFLVGGNAAGTTEAAAYKCAQFILKVQEAPRHDTPFWIASNTYEQTMDVCWKEKLLEHGHIPRCEVDWPRVSWHDVKQGHPKVVPLKPWPAGNPDHNWRLEFKSFDQQRTALQAKSIGGFWFSEQFPLDRFLETLRGCRDYMYPGSMFAEFTPIDPTLCMWVEDAMEEQRPGWAFYRANTECNRENLADGWFESFFAGVPDEMLATRMTGALASFEGVIYQSFNPAVHVVDGPTVFPDGVFHYRGGDWGASAEHPFTWIWAYRDGIGDWHVYDEYWSADQGKITLDHLVAIVEQSRGWGWPGKWKEDSEIGPVWLPEESPNHLHSFADPSRPGEINEFGERGVPTFPASNDVLKGIDCVRGLLKIQPSTNRPRLTIHARCKRLIQELRKYRWLRGRRPTEGTFLNPKTPIVAPLKRDDDLADALRYCIFSAERQRGVGPGSMRHADYSRRRSVQINRGREADQPRRAASDTGWFQPK